MTVMQVLLTNKPYYILNNAMIMGDINKQFLVHMTKFRNFHSKTTQYFIDLKLKKERRKERRINIQLLRERSGQMVAFTSQNFMLNTPPSYRRNC
jgi:hypothetical protein